MSRTNGQTQPVNKDVPRRRWWERHKLSKPPLLWDYANKCYRRIPYEKMHQNVSGSYYIDVKDDPELVSLAAGNPRYFDRVDTPMFWELRHKRKSWFNGQHWALGLSITLNITVALFNISVSIVRYFVGY